MIWLLGSLFPESNLEFHSCFHSILAAWYFLGQDSPKYPAVNFDAFQTQNQSVNEHVNVQADHYKIVRQIGSASTVLLKNLRSTLPLNKPKSLAIIGSDARPSVGGPNMFSDQGGVDGKSESIIPLCV